jgi:hypothetical protein
VLKVWKLGRQVANYALVGHNTRSSSDSGHAVLSWESTMARQGTWSVPECFLVKQLLEEKMQLLFPC